MEENQAHCQQEDENNKDLAERGEDVAQEGLQLLGEERGAVCQQTSGASHVPEEEWVGAEVEEEGEGGEEEEEVKKKWTSSLNVA